MGLFYGIIDNMDRVKYKKSINKKMMLGKNYLFCAYMKCMI